MKIVIELNEEDREKIKNAHKGFFLDLYKVMTNAINNGFEIPKGHGALINRSEVIKNLLDYKKGKKTLGQCIEDVQTIIEADWEDEEE